MSWAWTPAQDGDVFDAVYLNGLFSTAKTWLDDIEASGIREGSFNRHHCGDIMRDAILLEGDESATHVYNQSVFGASIVYSSYGADGGTTTAGDLGSGDRIVVGHPSATGGYTGAKAEYNWLAPGRRVGMANGSTSDNCNSIVLQGNVALVDIDPASAADLEFMLCFQYQNSSDGTWRTIDHSERFWRFDDKIIGSENVGLDCAVDAVLTPDIFDEHGAQATDYVQGVRMMASLYATGTTTNIEFTLNSWSMLILRPYASDL